MVLKGEKIFLSINPGKNVNYGQKRLVQEFVPHFLFQQHKNLSAIITILTKLFAKKTVQELVNFIDDKIMIENFMRILNYTLV